MERTGAPPSIQGNLDLGKCLNWGTEGEASGWPAEGEGRQEKGERGGSVRHPHQPMAEEGASVTEG